MCVAGNGCITAHTRGIMPLIHVSKTVPDALGLLETTGFSPAIVALDTMEKTASIRVMQAELNDFLGVCIKVGVPLTIVVFITVMVLLPILWPLAPAIR